ncbi:hypothetical protein [Methylorubrum populi]|uniref:hypothetical protein n=1 Tax=Methylorubrum populi TaxID=223967 RepID=UPI001264835C|nr:hypothetical protein [Methylorubrum populi]
MDENETFFRDACAAFNARTLCDETAQYVARGRVYRDLPEDELSLIYVFGMREWDRIGHPRPQFFADAEGEYQVRGIKPPYNEVRAERERLFARAEAALRGMSDEDQDAFVTEIAETYAAEASRPN